MTEFEQLVQAMRHAQRQYFKSREPKFLAESKKYEAQVDKYLLDKLNEQQQPSLFRKDEK